MKTLTDAEIIELVENASKRELRGALMGLLDFEQKTHKPGDARLVAPWLAGYLYTAGGGLFTYTDRG